MDYKYILLYVLFYISVNNTNSLSSKIILYKTIIKIQYKKLFKAFLNDTNLIYDFNSELTIINLNINKPFEYHSFVNHDFNIFNKINIILIFIY